MQKIIQIWARDTNFLGSQQYSVSLWLARSLRWETTDTSWHQTILKTQSLEKGNGLGKAVPLVGDGAGIDIKTFLKFQIHFTPKVSQYLHKYFWGFSFYSCKHIQLVPGWFIKITLQDSHLYEISMIVKLLHVENTMVVARGKCERNGELLFNRYKISVILDESVLGNCYTTWCL